jgi:small nuclear ribonucleoprotein E
MLYENTDMRIEGRIIVRLTLRVLCVGISHSAIVSTIFSFLFFWPKLPLYAALTLCAAPQGFDEYMNLVLDEAEEVSMKHKTRTPLGRILLKGDNITMMLNTSK